MTDHPLPDARATHEATLKACGALPQGVLRREPVTLGRSQDLITLYCPNEKRPAPAGPFRRGAA